MTPKRTSGDPIGPTGATDPALIKAHAVSCSTSTVAGQAGPPGATGGSLHVYRGTPLDFGSSRRGRRRKR